MGLGRQRLPTTSDGFAMLPIRNYKRLNYNKMIKENSNVEPSTEAGNIAKPLLGDVFKCKHCGHIVPNEYSLRTPDSCYLCDENISLDELTSEYPI